MSAKNWIAWRFVVRPKVKRFLKENPEMIDFLKGQKTKLGAFGAFLATVAAIFTDLAAQDCYTLACMLAFAQKVFLSLGGFGAIMKLIRFFERKESEG